MAATAPRRRPEEPETPPRSLLARILPVGGLFPWWATFLLSVYLLMKLGATLEHPCSIIGTWPPMTRAHVSKSYRALSVCTHPDKLVGRSAADIERGGMLFARASRAREHLVGAMRAAAASDDAGEATPRSAEITCSTNLDGAIYDLFAALLRLAADTGVSGLGTSALRFVIDLVTFELGATLSISLLMLLFSISVSIANLCSFLWTTGPLTALLSSFVALVVAPLPTLRLLAALPVIRYRAWWQLELRPLVGLHEPDDDDAPVSDEAPADAPPAENAPGAPSSKGVRRRAHAKSSSAVPLATTSEAARSDGEPPRGKKDDAQMPRGETDAGSAASSGGDGAVSSHFAALEMASTVIRRRRSRRDLDLGAVISAL